MKRLLLVLLPISLFVFSCEEEVEEDTTPPTVSIQSPITNQSINEIVTIIVETDDNEEISKVEFYIDDSLYYTDTESPYEYEWNTTQYDDNSEHIVKVISYDNSGNLTESQPIVLIIDNSTSVPTPSKLYPILYNDGFQISWSQNNDDDFQSYKLYESLSEDMSNQTLVYETSEREDTNYVVTGISEDRYYQITTEDVWGLMSTSDIEVLITQVELWGQIYSVENTTKIKLEENDLTGPIPPEIGHLTNLTSLNLNYNSITGSIPLEIGNLTNLDSLNLNENQLIGSIPSQIGNLTNLEYLGLYDNQFTGPIPPEIGNLTNLEYLILYSNDLTSIPLEIGNLTNLKILKLQYNQLTGSIPPEIGNLTNLEVLSLRDNQLTGSIPSEIGNLTNLTLLSLSNNQLTGIIPDEICNQGDSSPSLFNNQLCPPYPSCIEDYVGEQDTSNCGD